MADFPSASFPYPGAPASTGKWPGSQASSAAEFRATDFAYRDANGNMHLGSPINLDALYGKAAVVSAGAGTAHPMLLHQSVNTNAELLLLLNNAHPTGGGSYTGGFKYNKTGCAATAFWNSGGQFNWQIAPPGTAGNTIAWADAMTLTAEGRLLVGSNSFNPAGLTHRMHIRCLGSTTEYGLAISQNTNGGFFASFINAANAACGSITQPTSTSVAYNTSSDRRLKKNIKPAPEAGDLIDTIQVRQFDWRSVDDGEDAHVEFGFVAQELFDVFPGAVGAVGDDGNTINRKSRLWGVDPSKLVPMMLAEIQSLRRRVAALEEG